MWTTLELNPGLWSEKWLTAAAMAQVSFRQRTLMPFYWKLYFVLLSMALQFNNSSVASSCHCFVTGRCSNFQWLNTNNSSIYLSQQYTCPFNCLVTVKCDQEKIKIVYSLENRSSLSIWKYWYNFETLILESYSSFSTDIFSRQNVVQCKFVDTFWARIAQSV